MKISDIELNVDVKAELEEFVWEKASWKENKLIACSPFRNEEHPSFYVFFDNGIWGDSGGVGEFEKGNFVQLLSFLRNETEEETVEYLIEKYDEVDSIVRLKKIKLRDKYKKIIREIKPNPLPSLPFSPTYLKGRGISENIQRYFQIRMTKDHKKVMIPWFLPNGKLGNIKYRLTNSKRFWYEKRGTPVRNMLYGIHLFNERSDLKQAVITESEIDSLSCMTAGFPSLAVGGSHWTKEKTNLILSTQIEEIIIATDNDQAGEKLKNQIIKSLSGRYDIRIANIPKKYKDLNEVLLSDLDTFYRILKSPTQLKRFNINI